MTTVASLQSMNIDLPSQPDVLVKMSMLLAADEPDLQALGRLIENDMGLAAAVMRAVNSPLYGVQGRVHSVQQAVTFLGSREVSAVVLELSLRAVFPPAPELAALWERARVRGLLMGRLAQALHMDAWCAHTAGLFEECGKAVLFKHAPDVYRPMLGAAANDEQLVELEVARFGIGHDELGARLCSDWGLSAGAVSSVRHHVTVQAHHQLPRAPNRGVCVLSALAHTLVTDPERLEEVAQSIAPQAMLDQTLLLEGARKVKRKIDEAMGDD